MIKTTYAVNKAWVLGDDRFIKKIEKQTVQRVKPIQRGVIENQRNLWINHKIKYSNDLDCPNNFCGILIF